MKQSIHQRTDSTVEAETIAAHNSNTPLRTATPAVAKSQSNDSVEAAAENNLEAIETREGSTHQLSGNSSIAADPAAESSDHADDFPNTTPENADRTKTPTNESDQSEDLTPDARERKKIAFDLENLNISDETIHSDSSATTPRSTSNDPLQITSEEKQKLKYIFAAFIVTYIAIEINKGNFLNSSLLLAAAFTIKKIFDYKDNKKNQPSDGSKIDKPDISAQETVSSGKSSPNTTPEPVLSGRISPNNTPEPLVLDNSADTAASTNTATNTPEPEAVLGASYTERLSSLRQTAQQLDNAASL
jgi:hypothetical protein